MRQILTKNHNGLLRYEIAPEITAFSPLRDAVLPIRVVQAHQVHGDRVAVVTSGTWGPGGRGDFGRHHTGRTGGV